MEAARLHRRIEVVVVTTRAATSSLEPASGKAAAVRRGIQLLEGIAADVGEDPDPETGEQLDQARLALESLLEAE